jgi:hypothetical protein
MTEDLNGLVALLVPIVAIVMGIGIGMLKLALDYRNRREMFKLHHAERLAAIEKGVEVAPLPPEFFQSYRRAGPVTGLRSGLFWLLIGVALFIALYEATGRENAWWGLIPVAVGAANLLYYFIAGRKLEADAAKSGTPSHGAMDSTSRFVSKP